MPYLANFLRYFNLQTGTYLIFVFTYLFNEILEEGFEFWSALFLVLHVWWLQRNTAINLARFQTLYFVCCMIAMYGLLKKLANYLIPMLVFQAAYILFVAACLVWYIIKDAAFFYDAIIVTGISLAIQVYFSVVMYSCYQQLSGQ